MAALESLEIFELRNDTPVTKFCLPVMLSSLSALIWKPTLRSVLFYWYDIKKQSTSKDDFEMFLNSIRAHPNLQAFDAFNGDMKSIFSSQDVYALTDRLGWALSTLPKWPPRCDMHCLPHQNLTLSLF
jgi:hypothetical protein